MDVAEHYTELYYVCRYKVGDEDDSLRVSRMTNYSHDNLVRRYETRKEQIRAIERKYGTLSFDASAKNSVGFSSDDVRRADMFDVWNCLSEIFA